MKRMAESRSVILEITSPALQCGAADGIISPSMRSRGWNHQPLEAEPGREAAAGAEVLADRRAEPAGGRRFRKARRLFQFLVTIGSSVLKLHLDLHETVVLRDLVCTAERTRLDLTAVRSDRDVGDRRVLRLAERCEITVV